ncbi:hypothetical protein STEG23_006810, partial [Scotinomys teguina]
SPGKGHYDNSGITEGFMATVLAFTATQKTMKSPDDCVTAQSIITESFGTANASDTKFPNGKDINSLINIEYLVPRTVSYTHTDDNL